MAAVTTIALAATAVSAGVGAYSSYKQAKAGKSRANAERERNALQQRQVNLENRRRKKQIIREAQIQRANSIATSTAQGATESSSAITAASGATSLGRSNLQNNRQSGEISNAIFGVNDRIGGINADIARYQTIGNVAEGVGSLASFGLKNRKVLSRAF